MDDLDNNDQILLKLINDATRTAASMNRDLLLDERKLVRAGATNHLVQTLRERNLIRPSEAADA